jgi:hypothetical protein
MTTAGTSQLQQEETSPAAQDVDQCVEKSGSTSISPSGLSTYHELRKNKRAIMIHEDDKSSTKRLPPSSSPLTVEKFLRRSARVNEKNSRSKNQKKTVDLSWSSPTKLLIHDNEDDWERPLKTRKRPNRVLSPISSTEDADFAREEGEASSSKHGRNEKRSTKDVSTPKRRKEQRPPISQRLLQAAVLSKVDIDDDIIARKPSQEASSSRRPLNFVAHGPPSSPTLRARALRSRKVAIVSPYKPLHFDNSNFGAHTFTSSTSLRKRPLLQASPSTPTPVRIHKSSPIKRTGSVHDMENVLLMTPTSPSRPQSVSHQV